MLVLVWRPSIWSQICSVCRQACWYLIKVASTMMQGLSYTADLDYANIPIMANVYVLPGLALKAGVQPGFRLKAKMKTDNGTYDVDEYYKLAGTLIPGEEPKVNKFDLAIPVGISYEYSNIVLDARYNLGLLKVENFGPAYYNRVFEVTLGYKFELDF